MEAVAAVLITLSTHCIHCRYDIALPNTGQEAATVRQKANYGLVTFKNNLRKFTSKTTDGIPKRKKIILSTVTLPSMKSLLKRD